MKKLLLITFVLMVLFGCGTAPYKHEMPDRIIINVPIYVVVVPDSILYKRCPPTESNETGIVIACTEIYENGYRVSVSENAVLEYALGVEFRHIIDEELDKQRKQ